MKTRAWTLLGSLALATSVACAPSDTSDAIDRDAIDGPLNGFSAELDELVPGLLQAYAVPGAAVGVIHGGEIWLAEGFGYADQESERPVTNGTAFNIGSISKTVAAWGVMRLVEAGELDLDAPAETYLTRWHLPDSEFSHDSVTVRRMLSHTAGLSLSGYPGFDPDQPLPTVEESLSGATNGAGAVFVAHEPGSKWQYSGGGYTLTQLIVEEITGQPFAEYMEQEVMVPLGMVSSSYVWDEDIDRIAATAYGPSGMPIPGPRFTAMAAASLQTTLDDFLRFALAGLGALEGEYGTAGLLSRESLAMMQVPVPPSDNYGLGYGIMEAGGIELVGHGGANKGWMARMWLAPDRGDGIVVITNGSSGGSVHRAITCAWQVRITGEACDPVPVIPVRLDETILRGYEGRFEIPDGPTIVLRVERGRLIGLAPDGDEIALVASSETEFRPAGSSIGIRFELNEQGEAVALVLTPPGEDPIRAPRLP